MIETVQIRMFRRELFERAIGPHHHPMNERLRMLAVGRIPLKNRSCSSRIRSNPLAERARSVCVMFAPVFERNRLGGNSGRMVLRRLRPSTARIYDKTDGPNEETLVHDTSTLWGTMQQRAEVLNNGIDGSLISSSVSPNRNGARN
jgi:hypothetical protein